MTAAVRARAWSDVRRRWRATVVLAVLVGIAGGASIAGVTGARRTESAMARFVAFSRPFEVFIFNPDGAIDLDAVARLPEVADAGESAYVVLAPSTPSGEPDPSAAGSINPFVRITEKGLGLTSDIPHLVGGRLPDPRRALEVAVNEEVADRHHLRPGSTLRMWAYAPEQIDDSLAGVTTPAGPQFDFRVTGIVRLPFDLDPVPRDPEVVYTGRGAAYLGSAFWDEYGSEIAAFGGDQQQLGVRLHRDGDAAAFEAGVRALPGGESVEFQIGSEATKVQREAEQATNVEALALLSFAILAGVAGLLVVGQGLSRQVQLEAAELPTLRALGMTRGQLLAAVALRTLAVALPGALVATAVAVAVSPLTPLGLARRAEIDPGVAVDLPVLALGAALVTLGVLARGVLAAWQAIRSATRAPTTARGSSKVVQRLAGAGLPPSTVTGVAMALDRGSRDERALVHTALVGTLAAVAIAAAALGFRASLERLAGTPELQGWNWDVVVGNINGEEDLEISGGRALAASPFVDGFSAVSETLEPLTVGGSNLDAAGVKLIDGEVFSPLVEGRPPREPGEVVLGGGTLERLGLAVGDRVEARFGGRSLSLEVVGRAVLNPAIQFSFTLDEGAVLSLEELRRIDPATPATHFLVRYADGVDPGEAFASLQSDWGKTVLRPQPPVEVENLRRVAGLPNLMAGLVTILAVGTLAHAIVSSVRRRRRDLAVLKTLGFRRRELAATVRWQATTLILAALLLGLPVGVAAGRWTWQAVADGAGAPASVVPTPALVLLVPLALTIANLVAALPARTAARTHPAIALRAE